MRWAAAALTAAGPTRAQPPRRLGGRCRLAAVLLKVLSLLIVIEPATWLILGLIDSLQTLSGRLDPAVLVLPPPPSTAKSWPLIGETLHEFWELASTNLRPALTRIAPQLKSLGSALLQIGREPGTGAIKFFIAIIIAGFLYPQALALADAAIGLSGRVRARRGIRPACRRHHPGRVAPLLAMSATGGNAADTLRKHGHLRLAVFRLSARRSWSAPGRPGVD
jgi:predicted PurR-regulated permease PerM